MSDNEQAAGPPHSANEGVASPPATRLFQRTKLEDVWLIEPEPKTDERGFFMRTFCALEFARHDLTTEFVQHSTSYSARKGTLRGMHFQRAPHDEVKVVICLKGAIWDVIIDLRPNSLTYLHHEGYHLNDGNRRQLYIPKGFAHGFQTLTAGTEVRYLISAFYHPEAASGVRHDDPQFAIPWPLPITAISDRDRNWPDFSAAA